MNTQVQEDKAVILEVIQTAIDTLVESYYGTSCSALELAMDSHSYALTDMVLSMYRKQSLARENIVGFTDIPACEWETYTFAKQCEIRLQRLKAFYEYMLKEET